MEEDEPFRVWTSLSASWLGGSHLETVKRFPVGSRIGSSSKSHGAPEAGHHPGSLAWASPLWVFI